MYDIRKEFVDGIQEIYTTLFTDGVNDGLKLYRLSKNTKPNVYGEQKYKLYEKPILLVCNAILTPTLGDNTIEEVKDVAVFKVPLKSLEDNNIDVTHEDLDSLRDCVIEFHNVFYTVENVSPKTFIKDVYLVYQFDCKEDKDITSVQIVGEDNSNE